MSETVTHPDLVLEPPATPPEGSEDATDQVRQALPPDIKDEPLDPDEWMARTFAGLRYRPVVRLGRGGSAEVYLASFQGPGGFAKLVVVKALRSELVRDPEMRKEFLREARLCARMNHPNVVQVYDVIERPSAVLLVMEYLEGQTLAGVPRTGEIMPITMKLTVLLDVLAGLHYSHELCAFDGTPLNLVHRDVSPQNVFICCDGSVKVLDFGVAKVSSADKTRTGIIKGKIRYMAPEQLVGDPLDRRADVFAVGCMLWEAAAGRRVWGERTDGEVVRGLVHGHIPKPSEVAEIDPELEGIILRATAHKPAERYSSAAEMQQELEAYVRTRRLGVTRQALGATVQNLFSHELESRRKRLAAVIGAEETGSGEIASRISIADHIEGQTTETVLPGQRPDLAHLAGGRRREWLRGLIATLATLAIIAAVAWFRFAPGVSPSQAQPSVAHPPPADSVLILIEASPGNATITLDSRPLEGNPASIRVKTDTDEHVVAISAEGYETEEHKVRFDRNLETHVILRRSPAPASAVASASAAKPDAPAAARWRAWRRRAPAATASASASPEATAGPAQDCIPPYRIVDGVKVYKPECL